MNNLNIRQTLTLSNKIYQRNIDILLDVFRSSIALGEAFILRYEFERSKLPYHINIIDAVSPKENAHSKILNFLFQYQDSKGFPIFNSFIRHIGFEDISIVDPVFTTEKQRIDLCVADQLGKYALIIENKIHGANDQKNQIENYIEKTKNSGFDERQIYVIYLTRSGGTPTEASLKQETIISLGPRYKEISYKFDVLYWLEMVIFPKCLSKDRFLISSLEQYIDHLNGMFHLRKIDKGMNKKLYEYLEDELNVKDDNPDNFQTILDAISNIDKTREHLDNLLKLKCFNYWQIKMDEDFGKHRFVKEVIPEYQNLSRYPKVGILIEVNDISFSILVEATTSPYYGIGRHNASDNIDEKVTALLSGIVEHIKPDKWWYWNEDTTYLDAYNDFKELANQIIRYLENKISEQQIS